MKRSTSSAPTRDESSALSFPVQRPRYLSAFHKENLSTPEDAATAPTQNGSDESGEHDSCNMRAAEWLTSEREESGLTIEQAATEAKVSPTTVWRRENGLVDLGALKQLVAIKRVRKAKELK